MTQTRNLGRLHWSLAILLACDAGLTVVRDTPIEAAPVEAAETRSTVLFETDFQNGRPKGMAFDREDVWTVTAGKLRAELPMRRQLRSFAYVGSDTWTDYAVEVDVHGERGVDKGVAVRIENGKGVGVDLRSDGYNDVVMYRGFTQLGRAPSPNRNGKWYRLRVEVQGNHYRVYVNRALKLEYVDPNGERPAGRVALAAYTGGIGECVIWFDNLVVTTLDRS
jgi:hypothetical protein